MLDKVKLQLLASEDGESEGGSEQAGTGATVKPKPIGQTEDTKVFSADYVKTIREEAKMYRQSKNEYAEMLRELLGLKKDEEVSKDKIEAYKASRENEKSEMAKKLNDFKIDTAIGQLTGYDQKLLGKLLDKSAITVNEAGEVIGLSEAVEKIAIEFPQVKVAQPAIPPAGGANPPPAGTPMEQLQEKLAQAKTLQEKINIKLQMSAIEQKKG